MQKQLKTIGALLLAISLNGCVLFHGYIPSFSQGNIITQAQLAQIHTGMPVSSVISILGNPVLVDTFSDNRFDYVYNYVHRRTLTQQHNVIIHFANGVVTSIN